MNFTKVCQLLNVQHIDAAKDVMADILQEYTMSYRHYHNMLHINDCQTELDLLDLDDVEKAIISFAIYEHDIVILPSSYISDVDYEMEKLSGYRCMHDCYRLGVETQIAEEIMSLINATALSSQNNVDFLTSTKKKIIADIDISIFGKDFDYVMDRMERGVRQEYFYVTDEVYKRERIKILNQLLANGFVYHTPYFRDKYNQKAIVNIKQLIVYLGGKIV
jgi:predicted metal-dependent HD superfamily phosphohydrolase